MNLDRILDVLDKAHAGPVYKERDFNLGVVAATISEKVKKYGLTKTVDTENPIGSDDDLADRVYQAGFEAAVEIGCAAIRPGLLVRQVVISQLHPEIWENLSAATRFGSRLEGL